MPVIKPTCLRDLKLRVNIVDVVGRVATLRKAGSRFKGLCPFHNEKSPSFHVDPDKGFYKCFGCGKAGDIISFVRETEQLTFTEAIETLGKRFNVPIEYEEGSGGPSREERSLRQEIFDIHETAAEHFHQVFKSATLTGDWMRDYWTEKRHFTHEISDEFKIGAAEPTGSELAAALLKKKHSEEALRQCGLFFVRDGAMLSLNSFKSRFRGRLMIPIRDHQGRVVAFTARQTDLTPEDDPAREAKYVNSPETPIFTKGNLLFNLDRARSNVGEGKPFVLVEGQLDALRSWSVGLKTAIAPQGTSITEGQLVLLRRYHTQVECFFDGDSAGQKAALRFLPMALKAGLEVRFLGGATDTKIDPDLLFLEKGLAGYEEVKKSALSSMAFACRALLPSPETATPEQKARIATEIHALILNVESEVARSQFLAEAASILRLPLSALQKDFDHQRLRHDRQQTARPAQLSSEEPLEVPAPKIDTRDTPEHHLLILILHFEQLGAPLGRTLPHEWIDLTHPAGVLLNRFLAEFEQDAWPGRDHLDDLLETAEERTLVASLLFETPQIDDPAKVANFGLAQLQSRRLEPRIRQIELALANTTADSNVDANSLFKELLDIKRQLRAPLRLPAA
ncbi:DNA primase [Rariglobus hedericola]|uniref:DNA primase n=1 Tax=Rariglobus hedericola TaxID=2597822 RepID=A0A556QR89_9BACT|nr:DNA primase [Rariglobus hedericola]TSJ79151.1 DNA primase [Rariglobus hedericola]